MAKLLETDLATRVYRVASGVNDALYIAANEPSLGMYRIQEHVSLTVPKVVEQRQYLQEVCQQVEGACYDLDYDTQTLRGMRSITQFAGMKEKMLRAIELKVKLNEAAAEAQKRLLAPGQGLIPTSAVVMDVRGRPEAVVVSQQERREEAKGSHQQNVRAPPQLGEEGGSVPNAEDSLPLEECEDELDILKPKRFD